MKTASWRCSHDTHTHTPKFMSRRSSKTLTIHLSTLTVMRPGEAINAFFTRWHHIKKHRENRKEKWRGLVPEETYYAFLLFISPLFNLLCLGLRARVWHSMRVRQMWADPSGGVGTRWAVPCLPSPMSTYTHTLWASVGKEEGIMTLTDVRGAHT